MLYAAYYIPFYVHTVPCKNQQRFYGIEYSVENMSLYVKVQ